MLRRGSPGHLRISRIFGVPKRKFLILDVTTELFEDGYEISQPRQQLIIGQYRYILDAFPQQPKIMLGLVIREAASVANQNDSSGPDSSRINPIVVSNE